VGVQKVRIEYYSLVEVYSEGPQRTFMRMVGKAFSSGDLVEITLRLRLPEEEDLLRTLVVRARARQEHNRQLERQRAAGEALSRFQDGGDPKGL
jgi:hypothetical protein